MDIDLKNHKIEDPKSVHGIVDVVRTIISTAITEAIGAILHIQGGDYVTPMIEAGIATSSPVTFDHAFKGSTTPSVVCISTGFDKEIVNTTGVSNTGFSYSVKYPDGSAGGGNVHWIAIGEKA